MLTSRLPLLLLTGILPLLVSSGLRADEPELLLNRRELSTGQVITRSIKFKSGDRLLSAPGDERAGAALVVRGDNITVDFGGAVLRGTSATAEPDTRKGVGVLVEGRNVTIRNARIHGYKVGLMARNSPGLRILDSDLSYNWKQRLKSSLVKEDTADWMSYHHNEKDEWLRYGAAIYLRDCDGFEVKGTRARGGQNGLMLTGCDKGRVWNSDFSFLSALGIGMYRSSDNRIMHNRVDWCVRGYSHGVYNRGQDSAGILIFEQCNRNVFAYNSVTHGGDGFFLWAGQTTMDTGQGGCNDNLLYGNDWSHAPTNGIEATFSRNNFINNKILENWHGIWGGYSYDSKVIGNVFGLNAQAIAWEHGQSNTVTHNVFHRDNEGIALWANPAQDPGFAYAKFRDTRSRDWTLRGNLFSNTFTNAVNIRRTDGVELRENRFHRTGKVLQKGEATQKVAILNSDIHAAGRENLWSDYASSDENRVNLGPQFAPLATTMAPSGTVIQGLALKTRDYLKRFDLPWFPWPNHTNRSPGATGSGVRDGDDELARAVAAGAAASRAFAPPPMKGGIDPFLKAGALRGRRYILVDEWGPYDFQRPLLWPRQAEEIGGPGTGRSASQRFEVLGPKGRWRVVEQQGIASLSAESGSVPGFVDVVIPPGKPGLARLVLEFSGAETTDYRGVRTPAGRPVRFGYERFFAPIEWTVGFYRWSKSIDPANSDAIPEERAFRDALADRLLLHELQTDTLDFASGGAFYPGGPTDRFATVANGKLEVPAGEYALEITSDDGVRVFVDDRKVLEAWKHQVPTAYTVNLRLGGRHRLRVEHFEIGGYAALRVELKPRR